MSEQAKESRPLTFAASLSSNVLLCRHSFFRVVMVPMVAMVPHFEMSWPHVAIVQDQLLQWEVLRNSLQCG